MKRLGLWLLVLLLGAGCARAGEGPVGLAGLPRAAAQPATSGLVFAYEGVNGYAGSYWATGVDADGRVVAVVDGVPRTGRLDAAAVRVLVEAAAAAMRGVGETHDCQMTDLSNESFRLVTRSGILTAQTYGLGCGRTAALKRLGAFRDALAEVTGQATEPYIPPAVIVWTGMAGGDPPGAEMPAWPLAAYPPDSLPDHAPSRLPGEVVAQLTPGGAGRTLYAYQGRAYWLQWRPVLPEFPEP